MMITLSEGAKRSLEDYLRQARAYLRGFKFVDADEIEQNVTEHIETELEGVPEPVSRDDLVAVLKKLGSPQQWVPAEEYPWWRLFILRLRSGPEDWRLAYMSLGLLVVGLLVAFNPPACVVFILASFIVSRAALSEAGDTKELKAQKWFLYPPLFIVYTFALLVLLAWPLSVLFPIAEVYEQPRRYYRLQDDFDYWLVAMSFIVAGLGLWWSILAVVFLKFRDMVRILFKPFADGYKSSWALLLLAISLGLMILSLSLGILYFSYFT
jgi:hypothetical protein